MVQYAYDLDSVQSYSPPPTTYIHYQPLMSSLYTTKLRQSPDKNAQCDNALASPYHLNPPSDLGATLAPSSVSEAGPLPRPPAPDPISS